MSVLVHFRPHISPALALISIPALMLISGPPAASSHEPERELRSITTPLWMDKLWALSWQEWLHRRRIGAPFPPIPRDLGALFSLQEPSMYGSWRSPQGV